MRRILVVLVVVLVNVPWAHDAWLQHQLDADGTAVTAAVIEHSETKNGSFLSFRLPRAVDAKQTLYEARLTALAYQRAVSSKEVQVTVLPRQLQVNRVSGEVTGSVTVVVAVIGDSIALILLGLGWWRRRHTRRIEV